MFYSLWFDNNSIYIKYIVGVFFGFFYGFFYGFFFNVVKRFLYIY